MDRTRQLLGSLLTVLLLVSAAGPSGAAEGDTSDILLVDTFITLFVYEGAADVSVSFGIDSTDQALVDAILDPEDLRSTAAETASELGVPDSAVTVGDLVTDPYPSREVYLQGLDAEQVEGFLGDANDLFRFLSVDYVQGFWILTATLAPLSEATDGDFAEDQVFANLWMQGPEGGRLGDHDGEEIDELLVGWEWDHNEPVDATATIEVPLASAATEEPAADPSEEVVQDPTEEEEDAPADEPEADEDDRDRDEDEDEDRAAAADDGGVPPWVWILIGVVVLALVVGLVIALTRGRSGSGSQGPGGQGPWPGGPGGGPGGPGGYQGGYPPQQGGYPPQQGGFPPQQGGFPPQQGGYPPQQGGYPPQQGGYPPPPGGYQG